MTPSPTTPRILTAAALVALAVSSGAPAVAASDASGTASSTSTTAPAVIRYGGGSGTYVQRPAQVRQLVGAPRDFKQYVRRMVRGLDGTGCDAAATGISVEAVRTDGYAVGGVSECGGYAALWGRVDGRWTQLQGTQDIWTCDVLRQHTVPSSIAGRRCYDESAGKVLRYRQR